MTRLEPASAVAASLCWLARQRGLPNIPSVRAAVVQRHPMSCAWCDYEPPDLIRLIEDAWDDPVAMAKFDRLPRLEQRRLVDHAQGITA